MEHPEVPRVGGVRRFLYVCTGFVFVGLGALGIILPILPSTPFFLLASWFFVRSSPALHQRLLQSRVVGGFLRDWHRYRGVRPRVKFMACLFIGLMVGTTALLADLSFPLMALLLILAVIGLIVVLRLPAISGNEAASSAHQPCAPELPPVAAREASGPAR